jgi:hypothetical protein
MKCLIKTPRKLVEDAGGVFSADLGKNADAERRGKKSGVLKMDRTESNAIGIPLEGVSGYGSFPTAQVMNHGKCQERRGESQEITMRPGGSMPRIGNQYRLDSRANFRYLENPPKRRFHADLS